MKVTKDKPKPFSKDRSGLISLCERHVIKPGHPYFEECDRLTFLAKNLYNATLYAQRQSFFVKNFRNYADVNAEFTHSNQKDYRALPAKVSKQVQMLSDKAFSSFFALLEKVKAGTYDKPVKIPKYLHKTKGRLTVPYPKDAVSRKHEGLVKLSKTNIVIQTKIPKSQIIGARIVPKGHDFLIEILYDVPKPKENSSIHNVAFVDPGLNNLMTVTSNMFNPVIYSGKDLKAINQLANKQIAKAQASMPTQKSFAGDTNRDRINHVLFPRQAQNQNHYIQAIFAKRRRRIDDQLHKISTHLVNHCVSNNVDTLIFGHNKDQKQGINLGRRVNQNFVNIPFTKLISLLAYKCKLVGIRFIEHEEAHTSKCSFIDNESIEHHDHYVGKRLKRGLFQTQQGVLINADVNASLNIGKKTLTKLGCYTEELHAQLLKHMHSPKRIRVV